MSGINWTIFALHFQTVIQEKELWGHFDGSLACPVLSPPIQCLSTAISASTTAATTISTISALTTPALIST